LAARTRPSYRVAARVAVAPGDAGDVPARTADHIKLSLELL